MHSDWELLDNFLFYCCLLSRFAKTIDFPYGWDALFAQKYSHGSVYVRDQQFSFEHKMLITWNQEAEHNFWHTVRTIKIRQSTRLKSAGGAGESVWDRTPGRVERVWLSAWCVPNMELLNVNCETFCFLIFLSRIEKLIDGLCLPENLNHIGETKCLRKNINTLINTGVAWNHQIITSTEVQKIMKSGRFFFGGGQRSAIMSTNN